MDKNFKRIDPAFKECSSCIVFCADEGYMARRYLLRARCLDNRHGSDIIVLSLEATGKPCPLRAIRRLWRSSQKHL